MKIEFVDFDGKYPCLCHGKLTLEIDGKRVTFGTANSDYPCFWSSGGFCGFDVDSGNAYVEEGPWLIDEDDLPEYLRQYAPLIARMFNENVPWGCCGGCI